MLSFYMGSIYYFASGKNISFSTAPGKVCSVCYSTDVYPIFFYFNTFMLLFILNYVDTNCLMFCSLGIWFVRAGHRAQSVFGLGGEGEG